jgi:hypothetical protein
MAISFADNELTDWERVKYVGLFKKNITAPDYSPTGYHTIAKIENLRLSDAQLHVATHLDTGCILARAFSPELLPISFSNFSLDSGVLILGNDFNISGDNAGWRIDSVVVRETRREGDANILAPQVFESILSKERAAFTRKTKKVSELAFKATRNSESLPIVDSLSGHYYTYESLVDYDFYDTGKYPRLDRIDFSTQKNDDSKVFSPLDGIRFEITRAYNPLEVKFIFNELGKLIYVHEVLNTLPEYKAWLLEFVNGPKEVVKSHLVHNGTANAKIYMGENLTQLRPLLLMKSLFGIANFHPDTYTLDGFPTLQTFRQNIDAAIPSTELLKLVKFVKS